MNQLGRTAVAPVGADGSAAYTTPRRTRHALAGYFLAAQGSAWPALTGHWPHTRQFERVARLLFAAMCCWDALIFVSLTRFLDDSIVRFCILGLCLAAGGSAIRRSGSLLSIVCLAGAACLDLLLPGAVQTSLQGQHGFLLVWAVALMRPTRAMTLLSSAVLTAVVVTAWVRFGAPSGWSALDDTVVTVTVGLAVAVIRSTGIEGVLAADRSHAEGVRDEIRTLLRTAEEQATTAVHQALHDDVLGALAAIGASVGDDPVLRQRTGQVAARLQSPSTTAGGRERMPLGEVLRDLAGASSLGITTKAHGNPDEWPTLDDVRVGVVRRAVTEAVRNVERHAGVETALLEADFDAGWFRVDVTDAGKGFVPGLEGTWGRRHSIEEPVRSVGGRVSTVSTPGEGTTVTITWPAVGTEQRRPSRVQRVYWATRDAAPGSTPVVLTTVLCVLVAHIYLAIRYTWDRPSALWQLLNAAVLILVSIVSVRRLRMSPPTVPLVVGTSLMIATCVGVGLALAPPGSLRYYDSFVVGMAGVGLSAVAFFSDALTATLVTAPTMGVLSFFTIDDPIVGLADSLGAHLAVLAPVIGAYVIGAYLRRVSSRSTAEARRLAELSGSAYRIRADQAARQQLTQFTRDAVAPWLVGVASGVTPLGRPATTSRAGELARQVRDELYLGGVLDSVLRDRVAGARRDGVRIDFEAKDGAALAEAAIPLRLLDRLLDDTAQIDRIRVGVPTSEDGSWAVSVVTSAPTEPLAPLHAALSTMSHEVRKDSFATTVFGVIGRTPDGEPTLRGA